MFGDLFERRQFTDGTSYYYSPHLNRIWFDPLPNVWGGIVAEEMGLGKTIEAIALIQLHPRPAPHLFSSSSLSFIQPQQERTYDKESEETECFPVKSTLIIVPSGLVAQWEDEIKKQCTHPLSMYTYRETNRVQDPRQLGQYDVVITTFAVLSSEGSEKSPPLRSSSNRKYTLHRCQWWRVIVDEGHILKAAATKRSQIIMELKAVNKWILTCSPFSNSVRNLQNIFRFLELHFCCSFWWDRVVRCFHSRRTLDFHLINQLFTMYSFVQSLN
ncbi:hypothetical protein RFI_31996 [Reticulomyxa filosa]|uniref:Helicase ATP-binding domain-containing protein n=1 Tax=Reticulomyxa filosa TaxID=46433 RepID=X6LUX9_RETFI|nr:hypothetical protein RFI_31996 [Reticulomyxa filosa]|eukprot:ETO05399.1 hypothetical protein RFI_31996 [Reticulomyxa filosa]